MKKMILQKAVTFFNKRSVFLLVIIAILFWMAAITYSLYLDDSLRYPDEKVYFNDYGQNIATSNIFSSDGINPTAFHPPLYPLIVGVLIKVGFGVFGIRLVNYAALFISILLVYRFLAKQNLRYSPIISVVLIIGYPVLFYTAGTLYPQTIGGMFLLLALFFYWTPSSKIKSIILTGLFLGLSILTIPTFLFVLPFLIIFSLLRKVKSLSWMILLAVITLLTISPWTIRNYILFDRVVLISSNFGTNFLIGNSKATTPNNGPNAWVGIKEFIEVADNQHMDEFERNSYYTRSALELIRKDPTHYGLLYFLKIANYFNFHNDLATKSESSDFNDILMLLSYCFMVFFVLLRLIFLRNEQLSSFEVFLLLLYLTSAFVSAIIFTRIRYRLPFDIILITMASLSIDRFLQKIINERISNRTKLMLK
jgi:4-amino-4-deoxy-L-arabinose transferase-like glycosyltransferase